MIIDQVRHALLEQGYSLPESQLEALVIICAYQMGAGNCPFDVPSLILLCVRVCPRFIDFEHRGN